MNEKIERTNFCQGCKDRQDEINHLRTTIRAMTLVSGSADARYYQELMDRYDAQQVEIVRLRAALREMRALAQSMPGFGLLSEDEYEEAMRRAREALDE